MLSYINERIEDPASELNMNSANGQVKTGLTINEYGVVDEYYLPNHYQSESELFGISRAGYTHNFLLDYLYFYQTEFADFFSGGNTRIRASTGAFSYSFDQYDKYGILSIQDNETQPSVYGRTINDNGQLVVLGTSYFFIQDNSSGNTFLRTAALL